MTLQLRALIMILVTDEDHARNNSQNKSTTGDLGGDIGANRAPNSKLSKRCTNGSKLQYHRVAMMVKNDSGQNPASAALKSSCQMAQGQHHVSFASVFVPLGSGLDPGRAVDSFFG